MVPWASLGKVKGGDPSPLLTTDEATPEVPSRIRKHREQKVLEKREAKYSLSLGQ